MTPLPPIRNISVTILGSGTCVPSLKRGSSSVLVRINDAVVLLDAGPGTMHRLLQADVSIFDITHLFISHFHPDHCGELVSFLFSSKYPDDSRRKAPLVLAGGPGFANFFKGLKSIFGDWIDLSGKLDIMELDPAASADYFFNSISVRVASMLHRKESIAFRLTSPEGRAVVYSGDTDYTEELIRISEGADLLICEAALPDALKVEGHLTPSLAGRIAAAAGVKKLVLTHFYPESETADVEGECRKTYDGPLVTAEDLMEIHL